MSKHTPGPWTHAPKEVLGNSVLAGDLLICLLCGSGEESDANGRLIAAAPELLEALKHICNYIDKEGPAAKEWQAISEWCERGQSAIARAEGGQP